MLPNNTNQFGFHFVSVICSQKFRTDIKNVYWIWTVALIGQLRSLLNDLTLTLIFPWEKCANLKNRVSLQTRCRMAAVSCFRVGFLDQKSIASWDRIGFSTRNMSDIRYNSLPLTFNIDDKSIDWLKPETAHEKSVAPKVWPNTQTSIETGLSWVNCDAGYDIKWQNWRINSFTIFALVKLLWNVMGIYRQKPITSYSAEHLR